MINKLKVGQVLWLKVRYQSNLVSMTKHPMLIAKIKYGYIEVIALDKIKGKLQNLYYPYNYFIDSDNPKETVLYEDSYAQLNTKLTIEFFPELLLFRKTTSVLSKVKLNELLKAYRKYQRKYGIKSERIIYMSKKDIQKFN